ncbi:MAG: hypothetical protein A2821_02270 [Candidatus Magasanikbacteria bacterium RIFCSPHIGHO2_01_FULL_41_23]|uniref:Uncharacterized protein n=1 Tax=Candidatus Magasanikbacteria bacterium RIFCSPLOWO2_01_FULL_40_15 TaxID=1798686 RepID=A0A1F6N2J1_9BACT|nr:MAG: hypothetical protein A2821_02270 [Candidatus Magasanikbacteria bacterium RIFCSPHIGHO2_01_FULL_41_23]OGH66842.1 MAG: hypothetical protein A3C66_02055 [Candidatus Magasanikbacteria bacterium RIFCSPHIGHO2_02_FULL_41_35]OGH78101.1 MAG: hypothetical protein A2983_03405 [Candidatus Magasanikbacteria bacterium RIFCSPLOWO2_01_FULL_40_15]
MPAPLFSYCQNNPLKNVSALERLIMAVEPSAITDTALSGVVEYAALILSGLRDLEPRGLADSYVTQVLGFIDTKLVEQVATDPAKSASNDLNELAVELLHSAAAIGVVEEITPYTVEELTEIINSSDVDFNHAILAFTIGYAIVSGEKDYGSLLMHILMNHKDEELQTPYEWMDAFLLGLLIHSAWSYFPDATDREQQFILQHYFYYAIIMGVPVQSWLNVAFAANPKLLPHILMQKLSSSQEVIPENSGLSSSADFANVIRDYMSAVNQNSIPTLAAEKFLGKWYGNDAQGNQYRLWLRAALGTAYRLQTRNL